jgi:hypothetical protein
VMMRWNRPEAPRRQGGNKVKNCPTRLNLINHQMSSADVPKQY